MDYRGIEYLRRKLRKKEQRVKLRYNFYEMKNKGHRQSPVIPWELQKYYKATIGWCAKSVDTLADRLAYRGIENDYFDIQTIFNLNNPDVFIDSAIKEALIGSCSFVHVSKNENGDPRLSVLTAKDATGIIDEFTGLLNEGYAVLSRADDNTPIEEVYFTKEETVYLTNGIVTYVEDNPTGYPLLVALPYKPDSERPFGHSRISRSSMYYQEFAQATMERAEVSAEFYSFPQKYALGTDPNSDPLDKFRATISSFIEITKDEDGDKPTFGQFQQQSMSPYTEQLRMAAAMFAGETGLTLDDLGFITDNPSSAEAIKAAHESLRLIARKAQNNFSSGLKNVGFVASCLRDNENWSRSLLVDTKVLWEPVFEPDAAMLSTIGDGVVKINQAVPQYFSKDNLRGLTGIEAELEEVEEPVGLEETSEVA